MPHYKTPDNKLFYLDEGVDPIKWLPSDCVEITKEETVQIQSSTVAELTTEQQIQAIENTITPRRLREAVLNNQGKTWLKETEAKISALRSLI